MSRPSSSETEVFPYAEIAEDAIKSRFSGTRTLAAVRVTESALSVSDETSIDSQQAFEEL